MRGKRRMNKLSITIFAFFGQQLRKPYVLLDRERFGRRHLQAFLLGEFFRQIYPEGIHVGAMKAFQQIGWLCKRPLLPVVRHGEPLPKQASEFVYKESMLKPIWWQAQPDRSAAEQFQAYLSYVAADPSSVRTGQHASRRHASGTADIRMAKTDF